MSLVRTRTGRGGDHRGDGLIVEAHGFDPVRHRSVPDSLFDEWEVSRSRPLLVVAVKANCDGCFGFYAGDTSSLEALGVEFVVATATSPSEHEFVGHRPVHFAPQVLADLDVRWPPFYVLLSAEPRRVLAEGLAFGPEQVAQEIAATVSH